MKKPLGSDTLKPLIVEGAEHDELLKEAEGLPKITVCSAAAANAVMLAAGYFTPFEGYMSLEDSVSVCDTMKTKDGQFWPVPIVNMIREADLKTIEGAKKIALCDPNVQGNPILAVQEVTSIDKATPEQMKHMTDKVFRTDDTEHPGVAAFNTVGEYFVAGPIKVFNYSYFAADFPETFRTAGQIRKEIEERGWKKVVAFQTRNPMHRAHEELCKMGMEKFGTDGLLIHMLLGKLKKGDIPGDVRDAAIRKMVELYFPENTVMVTGYGFDMLYAGPREAVLHAAFRQNCGCDVLVVGRDHAGVGSYYGPFDAQSIFHEEVPEGALEIEIFEADHTAYSKKLNKVVMLRDAPDHSKEDFVFLSGTKVRTMLANGEDLPPEFSRPEVAKILMAYYQNEAKGE